MKALILNAMDKHSEAQELARTALRCDIASSMCWHVLGMLYRQDSDYNQALKSFLQASHIEPVRRFVLSLLFKLLFKLFKLFKLLLLLLLSLLLQASERVRVLV